MNNSKSTIALTVLFVGVIAFVLQSQPGASQSSQTPNGNSFNAHYAEADLTIGAGVNDPELGAIPALQTLSLPVHNRAVRISLTFTGTDGEMSFGETVACYKSSTGVYGFQANASSSSTSGGFYLMKFDEPVTYPGIFFEGGTNGAIVLQNYHTSAGSIHVAMWY